MFSESKPPRFCAPRPPTPAAAMFSFSLKDLYPNDFREGTLPKPPVGIAPASKEPKKKCLRETLESDIVESSPFQIYYKSIGISMIVSVKRCKRKVDYSWGFQRSRHLDGMALSGRGCGEGWQTFSRPAHSGSERLIAH